MENRLNLSVYSALVLILFVCGVFLTECPGFTDVGQHENLYTLSVVGGGFDTRAAMFETGVVEFNRVSTEFRAEHTATLFGVGPLQMYWDLTTANPKKLELLKRSIFEKKSGPKCIDVSSFLTEFQNKLRPIYVNAALSAFLRHGNLEAVIHSKPLCMETAALVSKYPELAEKAGFWDWQFFDSSNTQKDSRDKIVRSRRVNLVAGISGEASKVNILHSFEEISNKALPGDHVLVNLSGHGLINRLNGKYEFVLSEGSGSGGNIGIEEFRKKLNPLLAKGIVVHFSAQTCFDGSFSELTPSEVGKGQFCFMGMTTSASEGSDGKYVESINRYLGIYGNQLEAFACAMAVETKNSPTSSLQKIVERWESSSPALVKADYQVEKSAIQLQLDALIQSHRDEERGRLAQAYKEKFLKTFMDCSKVHESNRALLNAAMTCNDRSLLSIGKGDNQSSNLETLESLKLDYIEWNHESKQVEIGKQIRFLKEASSDFVQEFKNAFCCLSYSLKERRHTLDICKTP